MDRDRFLKLWKRCCPTDSSGDQIIADIEASYSEPHRCYHTGRHIDHCLTQFDLARHEMEDADAIELALWFHDIEYDPKAHDNELQSAKRFKQYVRGAMDTELAGKIYRLIMVTMHNDAPEGIDEKYVVDIDLSSFGLPWGEFVRDSLNVQREFSHLSDQEFARRNLKFLKSLQDRPQIFFTDFYKQKYEQTARRNIAKRIATLNEYLVPG